MKLQREGLAFCAHMYRGYHTALTLDALGEAEVAGWKSHSMHTHLSCHV